MAQLDALIDLFLAEHRESDGGYARITPGDLDLLHDIIRELIELKCDEDPDGDRPIEFTIVNRRTHEPMHYAPVPYRDGGEDGPDVIEDIEMLRVL